MARRHQRQTIKKTGIRRARGFLYFIDRHGDIWRIPVRRKGVVSKPQLVRKVGVKKEKGFLYFLDTKGNIVRVPMARGRRRRTTTKRRRR